MTIIGGLVFAIAQIRKFRAQRREAVAVALIRSFHDPRLARESEKKEAHPAHEQFADWRPGR